MGRISWEPGSETIPKGNRNHDLYGFKRPLWALGHGISDADTGQVVSIEGGTLYETQIMGIEKGTIGKPGVMSGLFIMAHNPSLAR